MQLTFTLKYPPDQPFGVFFAPRGTSVHFTSWRMPLDGSVEAHDFHTHGGKGILVETWRSLPPQLTHWVLRACDSQRGPTPIQWSWPRWELGRWIRCDHWELSWHPFVRCRPAYTQHYASDERRTTRERVLCAITPDEEDGVARLSRDQLLPPACASWRFRAGDHLTVIAFLNRKDSRSKTHPRCSMPRGSKVTRRIV